MSITKNTSRFDILPDDAGDPFEVASKKNRKKTGSGSGDGSKKVAKKGNSASDRKQLQSLAFGSASEGKKKNKGAANQNQSQQNGNTISVSNADSNSSSSSSKEVTTTAKAPPVEVREQKNGNSAPAPVKKAMVRPKGLSNEQWEQWQKRDADNVDEAYASDLQTALLQSQIEFETEQKNKPLGKGKKKKPVAVSLTDFQARLTESAAMPNQNHMPNGGLNIPYLGSQNYQVQQHVSEHDEELVERFREEARLELERERQKAIERQLLMSRQPPPPVVRSSVVQGSQAATGVTPSPVDQKDLLIASLTEENMRLKNDISMLKDRVKTINNYLQAAQEVKDKAKLIYELENMTKANNDLNEDLRQVHSQLEQEKSRSGAAMMELRKLLENRRRTATEGSNS